MNVLEFAAALSAAFAWPVAVLGVIWLLRAELRAILPGLQRVGYGRFEAEFEAALQKAEEVAASVDVAEALTRREGEGFDKGTTLRACLARLALISPRAAVAEAWSDVERSLGHAASRARGPNRSAPALSSTRMWIGGVVDGALFNLIQELRALRNRAVHAHDFNLSAEQAMEYALLAERVIAGLETDSETGLREA